MKLLSFITLNAALLMQTYVPAQTIEYTEYDLDNGLHVILHQDKRAPLAITSVMYHVGAKDESPDRTGFAHFFEHLLFEGTENIKRGEWFKIVSEYGGTNNANTSDDRTYYYEVFPSNALEVGLWMEAERMLHPVIDQVGVNTQNEVVKEEKRLRVDNSPYGSFFAEIKKNLFKKHPYRWTTIGEMEHLDAATLDEFKAFNKKFYIPNNACLVVAGDIDMVQTKEWIEKYFGGIPAGEPLQKKKFVEDPIAETITAEYRDPNIQIPAIIAAWRTPAQNAREAFVLDMISTYLSDGKSSVLYKKMVDDKRHALEVASYNAASEDYGTYMIFAMPNGDQATMQTLLDDIDEEIHLIQKELISEKDFQKLLNKKEMEFISSNNSVTRIASSLATYYMLYGDISLINKTLDIYKSITREEMREVAKKYLNTSARLELHYLTKE